MQKNLIKKLNTGIKKFEPQLGITIIDNDHSVETKFYRVDAFEEQLISFSLKTVSNKLIKLNYSFKTGKLQKIKDNSAVIILDLFSNRHLRSILFYSWDFKYRHENKLDEYNTLLHKRFPVPMLQLSTNGAGNEKKWFKMDNVEIVGSSIKMTGILSIDDMGFFDQPIVATCIRYLKNDVFKWSYQIAGTNITRSCKERYYTNNKLQLYDDRLLQLYTELDNYHYCQRDDTNDKYQELTKTILRKLKNSEFISLLHSNNVPRFQFFFIKRVVEINDREIVFDVCKYDNLSTHLVYDRMRGGFYANKKSRKPLKYELFPAEKGINFINVIRLIERYESKNKNR